jgi:stage V sporulation protein SpoVS
MNGMPVPIILAVPSKRHHESRDFDNAKKARTQYGQSASHRISNYGDPYTHSNISPGIPIILSSPQPTSHLRNDFYTMSRQHDYKREPDIPFVKVLADSKPNKTGGFFAHMVRRAAENKDSNSLPLVLAAQSQAVNQAIKSIAIARSYLRDKDRLDIICTPNFATEAGNPMDNQLSLALQWIPLAGEQSHDNSSEPARGSGSIASIVTELRVAQQSKPSIIAGAIAKKIRAKEDVVLMGVGPVSVSRLRFHVSLLLITCPVCAGRTCRACSNFCKSLPLGRWNKYCFPARFRSYYRHTVGS